MDIEWMLLGLLKIVLINIVLSGDNAVVIALACRNLPVEQRKKAVLFGSLGAIVLRVLLTFAAVWLLQIPFVQVLGAVLLIWIAIKLMKNEEQEEKLKSSQHLGAAIRTILIADLVMSLDNVLAVAGAAEGHFLLISFGLGISIPLIIWGSKLLMALMNRFPLIVVLGVGLLGYTSGEMMLTDEAVANLLGEVHPTLHAAIPVLLAVAVIVIGQLLRKRQKDNPCQADPA